MQPYQKASEEVRRQGELPLKLAKGAASIASTAATGFIGGSAIGRILPFLSQYIPQDLAIKGLNKIDPRFGKFINIAMNAGADFENVKEFIREKAEGFEESQAKKAAPSHSMIESKPKHPNDPSNDTTIKSLLESQGQQQPQMGQGQAALLKILEEIKRSRGIQ